MIDIAISKTLKGANNEFKLDVKIKLENNSLTAISGASGAGKTTLLRLISGLETAEVGHIRVANEEWFNAGKSVNLKCQKRSVGMVFQEPTLFPNMTVIENLRFAKQGSTSIEECIEQTQIGELLNRKTNQLSGGQKQRIALCRALVQSPKILLLDEPFSALDPKTRHELQNVLREIHTAHKLTTIMVSHDRAEILKTADQMIEMQDGSIAKIGKPSEVIGSNSISGKFQIIGDLVDLKREGIIVIASVLAGPELIKVVLEPKEATKLIIGDKVLVASKAFNPVIKKLV